MADLPHRRYGNFPQRQSTLLPREAMCRLQLALEAISSETGPNPTSTAEEPSLPAEHLSSTGFCEMEKKEPNWSYNGKTTAASLSSEKQHHPDKSVTALLKRIGIHPEAQRILGNSCIAVVSLERLNLQSVSLSSLQPVVSLARLPSHAELHNDVCCLDRPQQNGFSHYEADILEIEEGTPRSNPAESPDLIQPETAATSWTEPYCPDSSPSTEPEQDSGFDCDSNPDQPYILCSSGSNEWDRKTDSDTFYLDPHLAPTPVIELDSEPESDQDQSEDQRERSCSPTQEVANSSIQKPETGAESEEMESEDFCAVCLNGGDLLCCDRCPKVYHLACHIPPLISFPLGDWVCTLCRTDHEPVEAYDCENMHSCGGFKAPYTLSNQDQRRCEKLTLLLYCHLLSAPFHEPVSPLARNYYQIIKRPIDLSVIRRKLDKSNTLHYFTAEQFIDDVLLMFKNCATFNYPDSEVGQAGRNLEVFFFSKLKEIFPDRTFPSASQDKMDRVRRQWLSRKRKENYRKKRCVFKKYYL